MGLRKGIRNNPNGRPKGVPNKITADLRQRISKFLNDNWEGMQADFDKMEPKDRNMFLDKLIQYQIAKPQNFDIQIEYRELERLLERTPEKYIERITAKIIELNTLNSQDNDTPEHE